VKVRQSRNAPTPTLRVRRPRARPDARHFEPSSATWCVASSRCSANRSLQPRHRSRSRREAGGSRPSQHGLGAARQPLATASTVGAEHVRVGALPLSIFRGSCVLEVNHGDTNCGNEEVTR
jgi:hypothetical protein